MLDFWCVMSKPLAQLTSTTLLSSGQPLMRYPHLKFSLCRVQIRLGGFFLGFESGQDSFYFTGRVCFYMAIDLDMISRTILHAAWCKYLFAARDSCCILTVASAEAHRSLMFCIIDEQVNFWSARFIVRHCAHKMTANLPIRHTVCTVRKA